MDGSMRQMQLLFLAVIFIACMASSSLASWAPNSWTPTPPPPPSHDQLFWGGRRPATCDKKPTLCLDKRNNPAGPTCCNRQCVDILTNRDYCGSCRNRCIWGYSCCNGRCVNLSRDARNCGQCGRVCKKNKRCSYGLCGY